MLICIQGLVYLMFRSYFVFSDLEVLGEHYVYQNQDPSDLTL